MAQHGVHGVEWFGQRLARIAQLRLLNQQISNLCAWMRICRRATIQKARNIMVRSRLSAAAGATTLPQTGMTQHGNGAACKQLDAQTLYAQIGPGANP